MQISNHTTQKTQIKKPSRSWGAFLLDSVSSRAYLVFHDSAGHFLGAVIHGYQVSATGEITHI